MKNLIKERMRSGKPLGTSVYGDDIYAVQAYQRFVDQGYTVLLIDGDEWMFAGALRRLGPCFQRWPQ